MLFWRLSETFMMRRTSMQMVKMVRNRKKKRKVVASISRTTQESFLIDLYKRQS